MLSSLYFLIYVASVKQDGTSELRRHLVRYP